MVHYPLWDGWNKVANPVNKIAGWLTVFIAIILWILNPMQKKGYDAALLLEFIHVLICGILAGVFYFLSVQKDVDARNLTSEMHVWLWICFVTSWFAGIAGILIWIQFVMVGILSDIPFWAAFGND